MLNRTNLFVFILLVICIPVVFAQEAPVLQLTNDPAFDGRPAWAPTGNVIAFISNRGKHTTLGDVWAINPDGTNLHQLTATPDNFEFGTASIAWLGSTGDIVVLDTEDFWEYFRVQLSSAPTFPIVRTVVDNDSPFFERLLFIPGGLGSNSFAISPDGTTAAWTILTTPTSSCPWQSDFRIAPLASMNGDSGTIVGNSLLQASSNCPSNAGESFRGIAFSPNGSEIVVSRNVDPNSTGFDLEIYKIDGTFVRQLTFNGTDPAAPIINDNPSWSSDNRIAFASNVSGRFEIYAIGADGSNPIPTQVTFYGGDWPTWSPDSSKIAFQSTRDGNSEIYTISTGFLDFPLKDRGPDDTDISVVFDHSVKADKTTNSPLFYRTATHVIAYTGEEGSLNCGHPPCHEPVGTHGLQGYKNKADSAFLITGNHHYTGGPPCENGPCTHFLFYTGHSGFDYPQLFRVTEILAPADGRLYIPPADPLIPNKDPVDEFDILAIDHGNGFASWFLHLGCQAGTQDSKGRVICATTEDFRGIDVNGRIICSHSQLTSTGCSVKRGDIIGLVGNKGLAPRTGVAHLHFEVRKGIKDNSAGLPTCSIGSCVPVDPYGWTALTPDPYSQFLQGQSNVRLWR